VLLTGEHGVRMQHNYVHDVPGGPHNGPQWLRLTRSGDTITGYESDDGRTWTEVGTAELTGLPETVEIGLFATSPGALWDTASAFAQATATFDKITPRGASGAWRRDDVGVVMESDGRTPHHPGGAVASGDKLIVTGGGDIGPATVEGGVRADLLLIGGALGLIPVFVAAVTFRTAERRRRPVGSGPYPARLLAAKALVVGAAAFVTGLVASGVVIPAGLAMLRANQNPIQPITLATELRVIVGYAALTAAAAVLALGLAALVKRGIVATVLAITLVVVPYLSATAGLATWLLMVTPAAGFAITQSVPTFAQVDVGPSPIVGYHPLPPWAGLTVTCAYAALALAAAMIVGVSGRGRWP
ncbi:MAG: ABC transporter permease subunit, partial [Micromonosporaceae bacterium]